MGWAAIAQIAIAAVGAGVSMASSRQQANAAQEAANAQQEYNNAMAQQSLNDAAYAMDEANQQAERIRRAAKSQIGAANAALAASGVKLGEGTPLEIAASINEDAELDAISYLLSGQRESERLTEQARLYGLAGQNAVNQASLNAKAATTAATGSAITSVLGTAVSNWKTTATK
jgi:hypothetical protein